MEESYFIFTILLFSHRFSLVYQVQDVKCPKNWNYVKGSCLTQVLQRQNWDKARKLCQAMGGDLARPTHKDIIKEMAKSGKIKQETWVGIRDFNQDRKFEFISKIQNPADRKFWASANATDQGHCVAINLKSQLNLEIHDCSNTYIFFCQIYKTSTGPGCQTANWNYNKGTGTYFKISPTQNNYKDSVANCSAFGGRLAILKDVKMANFTKALPNYGSHRGAAAYIGLLRVNNNWEWSDSTLVDLFAEGNWFRTPSRNERCVVVYGEDARWTPSICNRLNHHICEVHRPCSAIPFFSDGHGPIKNHEVLVRKDSTANISCSLGGYTQEVREVKLHCEWNADQPASGAREADLQFTTRVEHNGKTCTCDVVYTDDSKDQEQVKLNVIGHWFFVDGTNQNKTYTVVEGESIEASFLAFIGTNLDTATLSLLNIDTKTAFSTNDYILTTETLGSGLRKVTLIMEFASSIHVGRYRLTLSGRQYGTLIFYFKVKVEKAPETSVLWIVITNRILLLACLAMILFVIVFLITIWCCIRGIRKRRLRRLEKENASPEISYTFTNDSSEISGSDSTGKDAESQFESEPDSDKNSSVVSDRTEDDDPNNDPHVRWAQQGMIYA